MKSLVARRRHPLALAALLLAALGAFGGIYAAVSSASPATASDTSQTQIEEGRKLYLQGCSSCHGTGAQGTVNGPTLIGVGAAAVDFQVGSGRMPMAAPGAQVTARDPIYNAEQIAQLAAYVASLAPGPTIPTAEDLDTTGADVAMGGVLFRTNCAQCHQAAGSGGALTQGKYAPNLMSSSPKMIWEAMSTGPQSMPVFSEGTISPDDRRQIIAYIQNLQAAESPGGMDLGRIGPVNETVFLFTAVAGALAFAAIWIGIKAR